MTEHQTPLEPKFPNGDITDAELWERLHSGTLPQIVAIAFQ